jgi:Ricin-type beta-trefoil lectin domain-like
MNSNFEIVSVNSGLVLDAPFLPIALGRAIQQSQLDGGTYQQWTFVLQNDFGFYIYSVNSGLCLSPSPQPGGHIQQLPNAVSPGLWTLRAVSATTYEIVYLGLYITIAYAGPFPPGWPVPLGQVLGPGNGLVVDVPAFSTEPSTPIQVWTRNDGSNQQWTFTSLGTWVLWVNFPCNLSVLGERNEIGATLTISGQGFPVYAVLRACYMGIPNRALGVVSASAGSFQVAEDGTFSIYDNISFTSMNINDAFGFVALAIVDEGGNFLAIGTVSAAFWVNAP